jgi:hypothetical protein
VPISGCRAGVWGGARGWNADQFGRRCVPAPSTAPFGGVWSGVGGRGWVVGTLLGPEGAGNRLLWCRGRPDLVPFVVMPWLLRWVGGVWRGGWGGGRLVVENCTVDASIF